MMVICQNTGRSQTQLNLGFAAAEPEISILQVLPPRDLCGRACVMYISIPLTPPSTYQVLIRLIRLLTVGAVEWYVSLTVLAALLLSAPALALGSHQPVRCDGAILVICLLCCCSSRQLGACCNGLPLRLLLLRVPLAHRGELGPPAAAAHADGRHLCLQPLCLQRRVPHVSSASVKQMEYYNHRWQGIERNGK
jgi:hypothetical protein